MSEGYQASVRRSSTERHDRNIVEQRRHCVFGRYFRSRYIFAFHLLDNIKIGFTDKSSTYSIFLYIESHGEIVKKLPRTNEGNGGSLSSVQRRLDRKPGGILRPCSSQNIRYYGPEQESLGSGTENLDEDNEGVFDTTTSPPVSMGPQVDSRARTEE